MASGQYDEKAIDKVIGSFENAISMTDASIKQLGDVKYGELIGEFKDALVQNIKEWGEQLTTAKAKLTSCRTILQEKKSAMNRR